MCTHASILPDSLAQAIPTTWWTISTCVCLMSSPVTRKVTGGILQPTIDFGQRLAKAGKKIWVRFVLVPGLTSSEENVENVAKICESFGDAVEHIDVLGFHQLGRPKWHMLDIPYPLEDQKGPSAAMKQRVVEQFQSHGFTVY